MARRVAQCGLKCLVSMSLFFAVAVSASAQLTLGYCGEETATGGLSNSSTSATISCAMGLTPSMRADYTFCSISYLRIYLTAPENLTSLRIWLRHELTDDADVASAEIDIASLTKGWNDLAFPQPYDGLSADGTLYCGYSYTQNAKTQIPTSGERGVSGSFYVSSGSTWRDMSSQHAPLCLRAGLSSNYQTAFELTHLQLSHRWFDIDSQHDTLTLLGTVRNLGAEPLGSFSLNVRDGGGGTHDYAITCDSTAFGYNVPIEVQFRHGTNSLLADPDIPVTLTIARPNGHDNQAEHATSGTVYYELGSSYSNPQGTPPALFVEEFTSEANGYCPAGQTHLRNALGQAFEHYDGVRPDVVLLSRHEGYGPNDSWHVDNSDYEAQFFGTDALTFAPAAWVNREGLPFSTTLAEDSIALLIAQASYTPYANILIADASFDPASRVLSATVMTELFGISAYRNPTLVVCVKQEAVPSVAQKNYYPDVYDGDRQHDVVRRYVTLPYEGRLLRDLDLEAVATGQVKVRDCALQQFSVSETLPADIVSADGLSLVAYICDLDFTGRIIAVCELKL